MKFNIQISIDEINSEDYNFTIFNQGEGCRNLCELDESIDRLHKAIRNFFTERLNKGK